MKNCKEITPFNNCPALDGYHCQTNSLAKIFHYYEHPLSEDMLLGLGAGMGFIYWKMKMGLSNYVFIGGRGKEPVMIYGDMGFLPWSICQKITILEGIPLLSVVLMARILF